MRCPTRFSFIESPDDTLQAVADFARAASGRERIVEVLQGDCEEIDLCAAAALNALALSAKFEHRMRFRGDYPKQAEPKEIVLATGLPKCLGLPLPEMKAFRTFPLVRGKKGHISATEASAKEAETQRLVEYLDSCLQTYGFALSAAGKDYFGKLVGEVITNAEEHSGRTFWWIAAYLRQPPGRSYGDCHLTVFNFGRSLAESLQQLPRRARLRMEIDRLIRVQRRARFFMPSRWTEENLWTLYALQEGVSRRNDETDLLGHYGLGTVKMIETFQHLGQTTLPGTQPMMCVVSGRTHVLFDNRYRMQPKKTARGEERRVIAFNPQNDLRRPPDPLSVRNLRRPFPGTLISLRFYLDPKYLVTLGGTSAPQH